MRRVAVCLSGQPRTYREVARNIREVFEAPGVQVDYYIHAWLEDSSVNIKLLTRRFNREELQQSFEELYSPKGLLLEHWEDIPGLSDFYWAPKTYSMSKALELCYSSGIDYDIVVWTRLDMYRAENITGDVDYVPNKFDYGRAFPLIDDSKREHIVYTTTPLERGFWCKNVPIIQDREFWGRPKEMRVFLEMYEWYMSWVRSEDKWRDPEFHDCAEHTWALYLVYRGIWPELSDILKIGVPIRKLYEGEKIDLYSKEGIDRIARRGNGAWDFNPVKCRTNAKGQKLKPLS